MGTPQEITNAQGDLVWSVTYRAYGNVVRALVNEIDNPIRFQGQYHDPETGLHYNRYRYYNPNTGRFLTPDPIGLAGGLNSYHYVPNSTGWVDPLGLASVPKNGPESDSNAPSNTLSASTRARIFSNIAESRAVRESSNIGNGLNLESLPISNKNSIRLLENRALGRLSSSEARADAVGIVNSFHGQIYMRRGQAGEVFESFSDIDSNSPASLVFLTKGLQGTTNSLERQIILALPDSDLVKKIKQLGIGLLFLNKTKFVRGHCWRAAGRDIWPNL